MNELIFNGKRLSEFGAFYDSHQAFNTPERDLEYVEILGRDGDLIIDNDRFKNIEINFPCYIPTDFLSKYRNLMAYLNSQRGYKRLEYSQEPDYYRLASFAGNVEASPLQLHRAGRFTLPFICKPQRFLKSGEIPVSASSQSVSYEGNPVEIDNPSGISAVSSLAVALNPTQDLNGYDAPWVGGAGKNKLFVRDDITANVSITKNSDGSLTINGTQTTLSAIYLIAQSVEENKLYLPAGQYIVSAGVDMPTGSLVGINVNSTSGGYTATSDGDGLFTVPEGGYAFPRLRIAGGAVFDNLTIYPMIRSASETDASFAPYENICPITGHSSASVTRTGKNLYWLKSETKRGLTLTANENGTYTLTGTFDSTSNNVIGNSDVVTLKTGTYILNSGVTSSYYRIQIFNSDTSSILATSYGTDVTFTLSADTNVLFRVYIRYDVSMGSADVTFRPMLRPSGTTSDFEPYQGQTVTIDLNGTRYGGTVDLVTGVLTVTHGFVTFDGSSDENWTLQTDGRRCAIHLTNCKNVDGIRRNIGAISNLFEEKYPIDTWNSVIGFSIEANGDLVVRQFTTNTMTVADFKTFLQSNPMQVCYPLETPQTVQLTAQQISLLTGINYISSSDEVTVTVSEPSLLENPTLFESKPLIRVYGHGTLIVNNQYITIAENPYEYIDIDCDMMDAFYGANNANQYVTLPNDYITLKSGNNYIAYDGTVEITPRWYEV